MDKFKLLAKQNIDYFIYTVLTLLIFHLIFNFSILNPSNISWLMSVRHDWGQVYLGWSYWRYEPWTFPLGQMNNYIYPIGSNMGYTDCVPLMALIFKPFSALLPEDFQYVGIWLLLCYLMIAYYTYKICKLYTDNKFFVTLAIVFILINPVLVYRGMHPALCCHGFLLASVYYYLVPATVKNVNILNRKQFILAALIAAINPYMTAMVIAFNLALPLKHAFYDKLISKKIAFFYFLVSLLTVVVVWIAFGLLQFSGESLSVSGGYGLYALNLNFFYNSSGFSRILPQLPWVSPFQYEGFMYLGLGFMVFIAVTLVMFFWNRKLTKFSKKYKWLLPIFLVTLLMAIFAVTNTITLNDKIIAKVPLPDYILSVFSLFRSSARFFWPAYYMILLFILVLFFRLKVPAYVKYFLLGLTLVLQVYDVYPLYTSRQFPGGTYNSPLSEDKWNEVLPSFKTMVTYPPYNNHLLNNMDYQDLCYIALKNRMPITTGYSARDNVTAYKYVTDSINAALLKGDINYQDLYITTPQYLSVFSSILHSKTVNIQYLDGYLLLYKKSTKVPLIATEGKARQIVDSIYKVYDKPSYTRVMPTPSFSNEKIEYNIEEITIGKTNAIVKGWAYRKGINSNKGDEVYITFSENGLTYVTNTNQVKRPDLTSFFNKSYLEDSGFFSSFFSEHPWTPEAKMGIAIKSKDGMWTYADAGSILKLNKNTKPEIVKTVPPEGKVMGSIDALKMENNFIEIHGWGVFEDAGSQDNEIKVIFLSEKANYTINTAPMNRYDVTKSFNGKYNYDNSGFTAKADLSTLKKGTYKIGLIIFKAGRAELKVTDRSIDINK